jgi:hypothetical protein
MRFSALILTRSFLWPGLLRLDALSPIIGLNRICYYPGFEDGMGAASPSVRVRDRQEHSPPTGGHGFSRTAFVLTLRACPLTQKNSAMAFSEAVAGSVGGPPSGQSNEDARYPLTHPAQIGSQWAVI